MNPIVIFKFAVFVFDKFQKSMNINKKIAFNVSANTF